jgi:murein DD-endopeptidase MepM/ murein hydrolase activator NlpD
MRQDSNKRVDDVVQAEQNLAKRILQIILFCFLFLLIPAAIYGWKELYINLLERDPPTITIKEIPVGLGLRPITLSIIFEDVGAGLDEVIIRSEQTADIKTIFRKSYSGPKVHKDEILLELSGRDLGFVEGEVQIVISAFDRSFWSNGKSETISLLVDYRPPRIEVLSTQHNAVIGGAELVFYRVRGEESALSGLRVGDDWLFPGFSAKDLDADFQSHPDVYFSFFAIPIEFDEKKDAVVVYAKDLVGNISTTTINYRARRIGVRERTVNLSDEFLQTRIPDLLNEFLNLSGSKLNELVPDYHLKEPSSYNFHIVNKHYRAYIKDSIFTPLFGNPKSIKLWKDKFLRVIEAPNRGGYGEKRRYVYENKPIGEIIYPGIDFGPVQGAEVRAGNSGQVLVAENLGIYGLTVIVDHGFGLYSLYAHLSSVSCRVGDQVEKGSVIGLIGNTGLVDSGNNRLQFQILLHGVPVNPGEWFDERWLANHVDAKIADIKRTLGILMIRPLS